MRPRRTRQLAAIEAVLKDAKDHPTAAQIHGRVAGVLPKVSLGTVYRNLEKLIHGGSAVPVRIQGQAMRYDGMVEAHDHFVCRRCGEITDLLDEQGPAVDTRPLEQAGFSVEVHALAVFGTCPHCG